MRVPFLEILDPGLGATLQDRGRPRWRRFGVPPSGAMDDHAASWANRLLDNAFDAPVLELLLQGARLRAVDAAWIAITGADAQSNVPLWRAVRVKAGDVIEFPHNRSGVWTYLAVENGFDGQAWLGSVSGYPRAGLGHTCASGQVLLRRRQKPFELPPGVSSRWLEPAEQRTYASPPDLRVWPGPQWGAFTEEMRDAFFDTDWVVTAQCDRVGYRLAGGQLAPPLAQIISEPVRVGSIQVPENGQPIVTMRDGPTAGGYPKLGMVDPADLPWLTQCRPGQTVRFIPADAA